MEEEERVTARARDERSGRDANEGERRERHTPRLVTLDARQEPVRSPAGDRHSDGPRRATLLISDGFSGRRIFIAGWKFPHFISASSLECGGHAAALHLQILFFQS